MNHNSNGMYNVLGIFKKLEPTTQEQIKDEAKAIYESVEAQGSVLKGIDKVEKRLSEAFGKYGDDGVDYSTARRPNKQASDTKFDTSAISGMMGKKPSKQFGKVSASNTLALPGEDDDISDTDPKSLDAALKHMPKIKESESGERPYVCVHAKKGKCEVHAKSSYEAAQKAAAKWKLKGTAGIDAHLADVEHKAVDEGKARNPFAIGMAAAKKGAGIGKKPAHDLPKKVINKAHKIAKAVNEGVNFTEMMKKQHATLEEMLKTLSDDIAEFKRTGHVSEPLRDCMGVYEYGKTQLSDAVEPEQVPAFMRKANEPGRMAAQGANDMRNANAGADVWSSPRPAPITEPDEELNELARLAGLSLEEAPLAEGVDECVMMGGQSPIGSAAMGMEEAEGKINVSTNMSSDGNKSVSINADGNAADQLMQMLKMAGLGGGEAHAKLSIAVPAEGVRTEAANPAQQAAIAKKKKELGETTMDYSIDPSITDFASISIIKKLKRDVHDERLPADPREIMRAGAELARYYQTELNLPLLVKQVLNGYGQGVAEGGEIEVDEAQGEAEYANVPHEEYGSVEQIKDQGTDMNRQKKQFADKPRQGDNPMATPESVDPVAAFGRDLMAEYQALKLQK